MDNYLIDKEMLSQFVDELIKKKPLPLDSVEEFNQFREQQIKALDDSVSFAIFNKLTDEQLQEVNQLLDNQETAPEVFQEFFSKCGVNLEETITEALQAFQNKFLEEGKNE